MRGAPAYKTSSRPGFYWAPWPELLQFRQVLRLQIPPVYLPVESNSTQTEISCHPYLKNWGPRALFGHLQLLEKQSKDLWGDSRGFVIVEMLLQSRFIIVKKDYASVLKLLKFLHASAKKNKLRQKL